VTSGKRRPVEVVEEVEDGLAVEGWVGEAKHVPGAGQHDFEGVRDALAQVPAGQALQRRIADRDPARSAARPH
jgi:hypothetical protein